MSPTADLQTWAALAAAALAAAYLLRGAGKAARSGDCASGCGTCRSRTCAQRRPQEPRHRKDR